MKKIMIILFACCSFVFAEDWETFQIDVATRFENVEVSYDTYLKFNGDSKEFIKTLEENPICYGDDDGCELLKLLEEAK